MYDRAKYKKFALEQLKGRWRPVVLMTLIVTVILGLFSIPGETMLPSFNEIVNMSSDEAIDFVISHKASLTGSSLLGIIKDLVSFIFTIAALNLYLKLSRSPDPVSLSSFVEGLNNWGRGILAGLYQVLWIFLWELVFIAAAGIGCGIFAVMMTLSDSTAMMVLAVIIFAAFLIAGCIPVVIKSIAYSLIFYVAAEFENMSVTKALTISKIITKDHKWNLFVTYLSFIGWFLLVAVTAGIAGLFVTPYFDMTIMNAYHAMLQEAVETGKIKMEDLK